MINGVDIYADGDFLGRPVDPLDPTQGAFERQFGTPQEASPAGDMVAAKGPGTSVEVSYSPADCATNHSVYAGSLDSLASGGIDWIYRFCNGAATGFVTFDTGDDESLYFVVVGNNESIEGSYGSGTAGERPVAEDAGACGFVQDLSGTCP
jgi:hypothetical protein